MILVLYADLAQELDQDPDQAWPALVLCTIFMSDASCPGP
jgi:hypothetical protein